MLPEYNRVIRLELSVVEFNNLCFIDFTGKFISFWKSGICSFDLVAVDADICRNGWLCVDGFKNNLEVLGGILEGDDIIDGDDIAWDVNLLAIDGHMTMGDKLSGLSAGSGKTHSIDKVIKSGFENLKESQTSGLALVSLGEHEETSELLLAHAIGETKLLLFSELLTIFSLLLWTSITMDTWNCLTLGKLLASSQNGIT